MDKKTRLKMRRKKRMDCQKVGTPIEVGTPIDFLQYLDMDVSIHILSCLDDPTDLIRASGVSRSWRHFVIANGLAKKLCLRRFPQLSNIVGVVTKNDDRIVEKSFGLKSLVKTNLKGPFLEDHVVYAYLLHALTNPEFSLQDCCIRVSNASSSGNHPNENIRKIPGPLDGPFGIASSEGKSDSNTLETLIYSIQAGCWMITAINIQPFEAFFESDKYSAKCLRIRVGRYNPRHLPWRNFLWTYTSPEFQMMQEDCLQPFLFKLPEPIICINGCLQVELLGSDQRQQTDQLFYKRAEHTTNQRQQTDGLFYKGHVPYYSRVMGRRLHPAFEIERLEPNEKLLLKYNPTRLHYLIHSYTVKPMIQIALKWWCRRRVNSSARVCDACDTTIA